MPWSLSFFLIAVCLGELKDVDYLNAEVPGSAVSKLTEDSFDAFVKHGNSFVEFYAPWCGHCKHFARSWEEIGQEAQLKGIRVAKVDATVEKTIAGRYGVKGFPTLLFFRDGVPREYKGPRNKEPVLKFCDRVVSDMVLPATAKTHIGVRDKEPVTYVLLAGNSDFAGAKAALEKAAYDLADLPVGFMFIQDPVLAREYLPSREEGSILSQLVRYRLGDPPLLFPGSPTLGTVEQPTEALVEWLGQNRFPMVTEITDGYAYSSLAKQGKYVVIGIYSGDKQKEPVRKMLGRAARLQEEKFAFGSLKLEDWDSFVSKRFGLGGLPRLIVLDGDNVHFELKGEIDTSGKGDDALLGHLADVAAGRVQSDAREILSPAYNFWQRVTRYGIINAAQNHWLFIAIMFGIVGFIVWVFWMICKETTQDEVKPPKAKFVKEE
jgi:protein disulfide-isomerase-like protein